MFQTSGGGLQFIFSSGVQQSPTSALQSAEVNEMAPKTIEEAIFIKAETKTSVDDKDLPTMKKKKAK